MVRKRKTHPEPDLGLVLGKHLLFCRSEIRAAQQPGAAFFLEAVALALDVKRCGIVQEAVKDGSCNDGVVEGFTPVEEALVAGHNHTGALVAASDQAEEQAGLKLGEGEVANLIHNQDLWVDQLGGILKIV